MTNQKIKTSKTINKVITLSVSNIGDHFTKMKFSIKDFFSK